MVSSNALVLFRQWRLKFDVAISRAVADLNSIAEFLIDLDISIPISKLHLNQYILDLQAVCLASKA
jgi:16S rRNA G527 N7-methylase RsmG